MSALVNAFLHQNDFVFKMLYELGYFATIYVALCTVSDKDTAPPILPT